jgi:hypothetical protein
VSGRDGLVRLVGYGLAVSFALVGLLFLTIPADVLGALNAIGARLGLPDAPRAGHGLYLVLAVAYMYVVTLLATGMARRPGERAYPTVLVHAKAASALLSIALFVAHEQYFAYLANFALDGAIAVLVYWVGVRVAGTGAGGVSGSG